MADVASRGNRAEEVRQERRRKPGATTVMGLKLHVPESAKDQQYVHRWVNDIGQRVQSMTADDWDPAPMGGSSTEARYVGTDSGKPINAVLMRKRKDWYDDDQKAKRSNLAETDKAILRGTVHANAGEADLSEAAYTPGNGNSINRG